MASNLALDDQLVKEAMKWGKHKTKRAAVTAALENYVNLRKPDGSELLPGKVKNHSDNQKLTLRQKRKKSIRKR